MQGEKVCSLCWAGPGQVKIHVAEHSFQEAGKLVEKKELQGEKESLFSVWLASPGGVKIQFPGSCSAPDRNFN